MNKEKELERHQNVIERINSATSTDELKNINSSKLSRYIASKILFYYVAIDRSKIKESVERIINYGMDDEDTYITFFNDVSYTFSGITEDVIREYYDELKNDLKVKNMVKELNLKKLKIYQLQKAENLKHHNEVMKQINNSNEIKELPKVGLSLLNQKILRAFNSNDFYNDFKVKDFSLLITNAYLHDLSYDEIANRIFRICKKVSQNSLDDNSNKLMSEQILGALMSDETILYTVEQIKAKEIRTLKIYKMNHEETMDNIKNARRISQLPPKLSESTLTSYLAGNSTIITNDNRIKSEHLKRLSRLLLDGHKWEDEVIKSEIEKITKSLYSDNEFANDLLFDKLSKLPLTYYLVDEINYCLQKQKEFIKNQDSNVNVYLVENKKGPSDAGKFYNVYISRVANLDLNEVLPTNLDEIVPPDMDVDSIEWYVQENYDETFKTAGGIILRSDETIGNVNIFKPNSGNVEISKEEKERLDYYDDLKEETKKVREELISLKEELNEIKSRKMSVENDINSIIEDYEKKALELQEETMRNIDSLKKKFSIKDKKRVLRQGE